MKIVFDPNTLQDWNERKISSVFVCLKRAGCAGTKVDVLVEFDRDGLEQHELDSGISVFMRPEEREKLDGLRLTKVGGKWIATSEKILSRCSCGSSFSFEKMQKIASIHKIAEIKEKFQKR